MKSAKGFLFLFFLLFAVTFAVPPFLMMGDILAIPRYNEIKETGVATEAIVVAGSERSNLTVNDVSYYSVEYEFTVNGETYSNRTEANYTLLEVKKLKTIKIKYDPETFESVPADFSWLKSQGIKSSLIFVVVFGLFDICFWIIEIVFIFKFIKRGVLAFKGKTYTAKFVAIKPGIIYNGTPLYSICYTWQDDSGEVRDGKSDDDYTMTEAHAFELAGEFKISAYGDISKIISKPSKLVFKQAKEENVKVEDYYECPYCKAYLTKNTTKCPSCGAPRRVENQTNIQ